MFTFCRTNYTAAKCGSSTFVLRSQGTGDNGGKPSSLATLPVGLSRRNTEIAPLLADLKPQPISSGRLLATRLRLTAIFQRRLQLLARRGTFCVQPIVRLKKHPILADARTASSVIFVSASLSFWQMRQTFLETSEVRYSRAK